MAVDDERAARVLLHLQRDLIETRLVLVVDPRRVEREEDRSARHEDVYASYRLFTYTEGHLAARASARLAAASAVRSDVYGHGAAPLRKPRSVDGNFRATWFRS